MQIYIDFYIKKLFYIYKQFFNVKVMNTHEIEKGKLEQDLAILNNIIGCFMESTWKNISAILDYSWEKINPGEITTQGGIYIWLARSKTIQIETEVDNILKKISEILWETIINKEVKWKLSIIIFNRLLLA